MIAHSELGEDEKRRAVAFRKLVKSGAIVFGGNKKLKIYGRLNCGSGKRMKVENRVFFRSEEEAINAGYRPCGNCLRKTYKSKFLHTKN